MKFVAPVDFNGMPANRFVVESRTSAPTDARGGMYFDTRNGKLMVRDVSTWNSLAYEKDNVRTARQVSLQTPWVNNTIGWPQLSLESAGNAVCLSGVVQVGSGTYSQTIASLSEYRPPRNIMVAAMTSNGVQRVDILANGNVWVAAPSMSVGGWVSLHFAYIV